MTYSDDLKRLHEARIDALERKVEELEAIIEVHLNNLKIITNENR